MRRGGAEGDDLIRAIAVLDSRGLLVDPAAQSEPHKAAFAWPPELVSAAGLDPSGRNDLSSVVAALRPHVLLGTSGQPGAFTEEVVRSLAAGVERPVVLPFSNPTSKAEATPADLIAWTDGRALVATGSPFDPVEHGGQTHRIGQGNNVFIFPGVGLGALVAEASQVSEAMFTVAAEALAAEVEDEDLQAFSLYPRLQRLRPITARIAEAVVREARDSGLGKNIADKDVGKAVADAMWYPDYPVLVPA
jgi:malate dehydrogenase (oxaloacetate-decarboxylating)